MGKMKNKAYILIQLSLLASEAVPRDDEEMQIVAKAKEDPEILVKMKVNDLLMLADKLKAIPKEEEFDETSLSFVKRMGGRY